MIIILIMIVFIDLLSDTCGSRWYDCIRWIERLRKWKIVSLFNTYFSGSNFHSYFLLQAVPIVFHSISIHTACVFVEHNVLKN